MSFDSQIRDFSFNAIARSERAFKDTCIGLSIAITIDTPVDTGRLRGNWQPSINSPATSSISETDPSGSEVIRKIEDTSQRLRLGDTYYFTNNLVYAADIEFGGSPTKSPDGMVRVNLSRWRDFLNEH